MLSRGHASTSHVVRGNSCSRRSASVAAGSSRTHCECKFFLSSRKEKFIISYCICACLYVFKQDNSISCRRICIKFLRSIACATRTTILDFKPLLRGRTWSGANFRPIFHAVVLMSDQIWHSNQPWIREGFHSNKLPTLVLSFSKGQDCRVGMSDILEETFTGR